VSQAQCGATASGAVRIAHNEGIAPQLEAIRKEHAALYVIPGADVSVGVNELDRQRDAKEPLQIPGAATAFINSQKELVMSFG